MFNAPARLGVRAAELLHIDPEPATDHIVETLRRDLGETLKRRGLVVAMSGGIDSSVCAALAVRAVGCDHVFGLMLPERDSTPESLTLATDMAARLGIRHAIQDVSRTLEAAGCYQERDDAIRRVVPAYGQGWQCKVVLGTGRLTSNTLNVSSLVVRSPDGITERYRLPPAEYRQIVAATNFKQRVRAMMAYYHADRLHYAVVGTPNRLEYDQGFFVKGGDGLADVKPIAHLYKTQVYALAEYLDIPAAIRARTPTTDTYSLEQSQEDFYFTLSPAEMDVALYAFNAKLSEDEAARILGVERAQIARAYRDIGQKRSTTRYLHEPPMLVEPVPLLRTGAANEHHTEGGH